MSVAAPLQAATDRPKRSSHSVGGKLLQGKLVVGASNDPLEQEADRVADQVLAMPEHSATVSAAPRIHEFSARPIGQPDDAAPETLEQIFLSPGRPLESRLRRDMERRFGYDFSQVRVHTDAIAAKAAQAVNADAYTVGWNIVFGEGWHNQETREGRRLLTHELAHVVQQVQTGQSTYIARQQNKAMQRHFAFQSADPFQLDSVRRDLEGPPRFIGILTDNLVSASDLLALGFKLFDSGSPAKYRHSKGHELWLLRGGVKTNEHLSGEAENPTEEQKAIDDAQKLRDQIDKANGIILYFPSILRSNPDYLNGEARNLILGDYDQAVSRIDVLFERMKRELPQWESKIGHNRISEFDEIQQALYRNLGHYSVYGPAKLKEMEDFRSTGEWGKPSPEPPPTYPEKLEEADANSL